jgi:hypothetical protein
MKLIPAIAPICALLLPCALAAESFEGTVTMSITSSSKDGPQSMNFSIKEGFMRMDMASSKGAMSSIMDFKNNQMIILMAQQRMYMVQPLPQPGAQAPSPAEGSPAPKPARATAPESFQDTGVKETILGYECTKYLATGAEGTSEIWVTDQLGTFTGLYHGGGPGRRPQGAPAWESALKGKNFFPMRVVTTTNGKGTFKLEVTAVDKTSLPDSLFAPPEGWTKFDMGAMMGGAMQGAMPGMRPPGSN